MIVFIAVVMASMYQLREATKGKRPRCLKCIPYQEEATNSTTQQRGTEEENKTNKKKRRRSSPSPANILGVVTKAIGMCFFFVFFFLGRI